MRRFRVPAAAGWINRPVKLPVSVRLTVLLTGFLVATACSADVDPIETEGGVQTLDAAEAAGRRDLPTDPDGAPDEDAQSGEGSSDQGTGGTTTIPTAEADPQDGAPPTYPPITDQVDAAEGGVRALLTPTGVLVGVTGQTPAGYVVTTPCGGETVVADGEPLEPTQVVLDPGHGGSEAGAKDVPGLTEADLNLAVARATAEELRGRGISVALSRNADYRIPIRRRAELADLIGPELFISIHHNTPASRPSPQPGTEVYVQTGSTESGRLGGLLYEEVFKALSQFDVEWTSRDDAGVLTVVNDAGEDAYGIARYPTTTSALIEMAYLGNEKEAALLATTDYLQVAAKALADGIERFLTTDDPGSGFVETPRLFNPSGATGGLTGCVDPPLE